MIKRCFSSVNIIIASMSFALLSGALAFLGMRTSDIPFGKESSQRYMLPKHAFALTKSAYDNIQEPFLSLKFSPVTLQLPDLKKVIVYYGKNGRPDAQEEMQKLHLALNGNKNSVSVASNERVYLQYDKKGASGQYVFSPNNAETPLWIEVTTRDKEALVKAFMLNDNGEVIKDPIANAEFTLQEKEYSRFGGTPWEIGKQRVDGSLLARQKARWFGIDRFLETHGGDEFSHTLGKQRVDFGEGDEIYSVFLGVNDCLIWENNRWNVVSPGKESRDHPLLIVKKIDERLVNFELWDVDGKAKIAINLLKSVENGMPDKPHDDFRFMGARTRSQFVFEVDDERMLLRPQDWLVMTEDGWKKLTSPEEIDAYVERRLTGPLFVFDGVTRKEDRQVLIGTIYNASRTQMQTVEMPLTQGGLLTPNSEELPTATENVAGRLKNSKIPLAKPSLHSEVVSKD